MEVKYIGDDLTIMVMDEDIGKDDKVGETKIKLSSLCMNGGMDDWFEISHKGKKAG